MIYFIQETGGLFRNRVKIGTTKNIKQKMTQMRSYSPSKLSVLLVLDGDQKPELVYHERFAKYRLHGEWFRYGIHLRLFIWVNRYKSIMLDELNQVDEPVDETEEFAHIAATIRTKKETYETEVFENFRRYMLDPNFDPTWGMVTRASFGNPNMYGTYYTIKLQAILNQKGYDYTSLFSTETP